MKTHVVKTTPDATIGEAADLMDLYQVSGLPVVDAAGQLCGYLAESDLLALMGSPSAVEVSTANVRSSQRELTVGQFMRSEVISVVEDQSLEVACNLLLKHRLKRIPVVDRYRRVVGTLNRIDILQALLDGTVRAADQNT